MCVIFVADSERPTEDEVRLANVCNADGIGVAWLDKGAAHWRKGLSLKQAQALSQTLAMPFAMHFRYATIGGKHRELTHPFPIERKVRLDLSGVSDKGVLMHNGHWNAWDTEMPKEAIRKGYWSDSRAVAWLLARAKDEACFEAMLKVEIPGKFAVIRKDNILLYGDFPTVRTGFRASNLSWQIQYTGWPHHYKQRDNDYYSAWEMGGDYIPEARCTPAVSGNWLSKLSRKERKRAARDEHRFHAWLKTKNPDKPVSHEREIKENDSAWHKVDGVWRPKIVTEDADVVAYFIAHGYEKIGPGVWRKRPDEKPVVEPASVVTEAETNLQVTATESKALDQGSWPGYESWEKEVGSLE